MCERIVVGQRDEIALMQGWLKQKGAPVPAADATHLRMNMDGMQHDMLMAGMLSPEELKAVDEFRFKQRMPSRAAAVRELFRIGLANTGLMVAADEKRKSSDFGVLAPKGNGGKSPDGR